MTEQPNPSPFDILADYVLNKAIHPLRCPTHSRIDRDCTCGLTEARRIARGEA